MNDVLGRLARGIAVLAVALASFGAAARGAGCSPGGEPAVVRAVNERSEIVLDDGRLVAIAGIGVARATAGLPDGPRGTLHAWLVGHTVTVQQLAPSPDRWGRLVADVFAPAEFTASDEPPISAAWMLVDAGLAQVKPSFDRSGCATELIDAEASARRARLGMWRDARNAVVEAGDEAALAERAGRFVIVEGDVSRIFVGRSRTFVDFGRRRGSFAAVVTKKAVRRFEASGIALRNLTGIRVRVRGILDTRFGPRIEVANPEDIERL